MNIYFHAFFLVELFDMFPSVGVVVLSTTLDYIYTENRRFRPVARNTDYCTKLNINNLEYKNIICT